MDGCISATELHRIHHSFMNIRVNSYKLKLNM